jgi:hypothetical protein
MFFSLRGSSTILSSATKVKPFRDIVLKHDVVSVGCSRIATLRWINDVIFTGSLSGSSYTDEFYIRAFPSILDSLQLFY